MKNGESDLIIFSGIAAFLTVLIPLFLVQVPPLVDYPNHLARLHILSNIDQPGSDLNLYYTQNWSVLPNLAMDVLVLGIQKFIPLLVAGKVFLGLIFFLIGSGVVALNRMLFGSFTFWPILSLFFLYNRSLLWGFTNYLFGLGVCLWMMAIWIFVENKSTRIRVPLFLLLALLLFFSHLYALGIFGISLFLYTAYRMSKGQCINMAREWLIVSSVFVLPAVLLFVFSPTTAAQGAFTVKFGSVMRKVEAVFQPVNNYSHALDAASYFLLLILFFIGIWRKKIRASKPMVLIVAGLGLCFAIMPEYILTVQCVDVRMMNAIPFFVIAGCAWYGEGLKKGLRYGVVAVLGCLFLIRMGVIIHNWQAADQVYSGYLSAFDQIEEGGRLFTAISHTGFWQPFPVPQAHVPCLAIISRSAFVPSLFANESQQPVGFKDPWGEVSKRWSKTIYTDGRQPDWRMVAEDFDYMLLVDRFNYFSKQIAGSELVYVSDDKWLFRVKKDKAG